MKRRRLVAAEGWRQCKFCGATIRKAEVLVGRAGDQVAHLWVDRYPHDGGRVFVRDDGKLRLLHPRRKVPANVKCYRVHSEKECRNGQ